jgi:alpha/beta superfamily hydrolase
MPQNITFPSGDLLLEGVLNPVSPSRAAILTHPHPLYGGDMHNSVVSTMAAAFEENGWSTLRFNFRGAGNSSGHYDGGAGEVEDIQAAVEHAAGLGFEHISLGGYSFGAWVLALWSQNHPSNRHDIFLIAPPAAFMDFSSIGRVPGLCRVITGEHDDLAPAGLIRPLLKIWQSPGDLMVIKDADHFFGTRMDDLRRVLSRAVALPDDKNKYKV